jgi:hypothetical protein
MALVIVGASLLHCLAIGVLSRTSTKDSIKKRKARSKRVGVILQACQVKEQPTHRDQPSLNKEHLLLDLVPGQLG